MRTNDGAEIRQFVEDPVKRFDDEWMTGKEASQYLKISYGSLRNMIYRRELPFFKLGNRLRFKKRDLRLILENGALYVKDWAHGN